LKDSHRRLTKPSIWELKMLRSKLDYQYGRNIGHLIFDEDILVQRSPRTQRIREVYSGRKLLAVVRMNDGHILLSIKGAQILKSKLAWPALRVVVMNDVAPFIAQGRSVYAKHVITLDKKLRAGHDVLVVDENDRLIALGRLTLSPKEIFEFSRGIAVRIRKSLGLDKYRSGKNIY